MELLKGVVGEDQSTRFFGDTQDESVTPAYGPGRRGDHLAVIHGLLEGADLGRIDAVPEGGVDHDDDIGRGEARVLLEKGPDGLVELGQAGRVRPSVAMLDPSTTTRRRSGRSCSIRTQSTI